MITGKDLLTNLFKSHNISIPANRMDTFRRFAENEENLADISTIIERQARLMAKWKIENRIAEIIQQPVRVLNATTGKPYESKLDFDSLKWNDITAFSFEGLTEIGLSFDETARQITGVPTVSGDVKFKLLFKIEGQDEDSPFNEKSILLIINPDPKSLWKNVESDKNDPYWKEDNVTVFEPLGEKHILVSSKRGRAHANVGSFREDDFAFKELDNGWRIVVVADGAGSAKVSRKGSSLACNGIVEHFSENSSIDSLQAFDELVLQYQQNTGQDTLSKINHFLYNNLGNAAFNIHKKLETFAAQENVSLKDLNTTLIFTLFKKYDIGYALLSFGVGDCPLAVLNKELSQVHLLNWIDVGDFGGGTRFITMPEIFKSDKFATRFSFRLMDDFSYLMLMSDGIYDPKFVVESNLEDIKKWHQFLSDLEGNNPDGARVRLDINNADIVDEFSHWMDFWSPGNHDDRTLAIIFYPPALSDCLLIFHF